MQLSHKDVDPRRKEVGLLQASRLLPELQIGAGCQRAFDEAGADYVESPIDMLNTDTQQRTLHTGPYSPSTYSKKGTPPAEEQYLKQHRKR
jgi:hypothetical protein